MTALAILIGVFLAIYCFFYFFTIKNNDIYCDICDINCKVKVIKKGFFKTTIAYMDKDPQSVLTLEFLLRYVPSIKDDI